jgi:hypothetical protein
MSPGRTRYRYGRWETVEMTLRVTDVWRKRGGQWKLINSHASIPVDLKTGKADMA